MNKKITTFIFCLLTGAKALCAESIIDRDGRKIEIKPPVKRIITLSDDHAQVIRALGGADKIVGISDDMSAKKDFWPELSSKPPCGAIYRPNMEKIVELNPDVVFTYPGPHGVAIEKRVPKSIKVVHISCHPSPTMEDFYQDVRIIGKILNKEKEAKEFVKFNQKWMKFIRERVKEIKLEERVSVFQEGWAEYETAGTNTTWQMMIEEAGGKNIAEDIDLSTIGNSTSGPYFKVNPEWVLIKNPEAIIKFVPCYGDTEKGHGPSGYGIDNTKGMEKMREKIMKRPGLVKNRAVKSKRVYFISHGLCIDPDSVVGVAYIAKFLYPDLFKDIHPEEIHKEYLEKFQHIKYKGIYVYPWVE